MPTATVTSKGQITIPAKVRLALGLGAGDKIDFIEVEKGQFAIRPVTGSIRALKGCVPKLDYIPTIEEMNEAILDAAGESFLRSVARPSIANEKPSGEAA
jgi:AbrB family looped-hinge helix DNA binding protein